MKVLFRVYANIHTHTHTRMAFASEQSPDTIGNTEARAAPDPEGGGEGLVQIPAQEEVQEGIEHQHSNRVEHGVAIISLLGHLEKRCVQKLGCMGKYSLKKNTLQSTIKYAEYLSG